MKKLLLLAFMASIMSAPLAAVAEEKTRDDSVGRIVGDAFTRAGEAILDTMKVHPAKTASVAACGVMIGIFPPALLPCGIAVAAGTGVDVATDQLGEK